MDRPALGTIAVDRTATAALFAWLDRELWLVTSQAQGCRSGLIATSVLQASIVPDLPRVLVVLAQQHFTCELIEHSGSFALHLLGQDDLAWIRRFGLRSGRDLDKLADLQTTSAVTGSPILPGGVGWMDCRVESRMDTGDRIVYLAQVVESRVVNFGPPLTFKQLQQIAPTDLMAELKHALHRDSVIDAQAILEWREKHGIAPDRVVE